MLSNGILETEGPSEKVIRHYLTQQEDVANEYMTATIEADRDYFNWTEGFILNATQGRNLSFCCGDPIVLNFAVESPRQLSEMTVGIGITTKTDEKVVTMSSKVQKIPSAPGTSRVWLVSCDMGSLPLNADIYFARVHVGNGSHDVARFSKAFRIHIQEHDVFGWGNSLPGVDSWGPLYWAPRWKIIPSK
jgi:hypothetical protein